MSWRVERRQFAFGSGIGFLADMREPDGILVDKFVDGYAGG